jgi:hypothetical protein
VWQTARHAAATHRGRALRRSALSSALRLLPARGAAADTSLAPFAEDMTQRRSVRPGAHKRSAVVRDRRPRGGAHACSARNEAFRRTGAAL